MPPRSVLLKRVEEHFTEKGMVVVEKSVGEGFLRMMSGGGETVVRIVDELASRDEMLATIIQAALDSGAGKISYVAIPIQMVSRLGDYAFRVNRLGVVVYDERDVVELVEGGRQSASKTEPVVQQLVSDDLYDRVERLENLVHNLVSRLDTLEAKLVEAASRPVEEKTVTPVESSSQPQPTTVKKSRKPSSLPSFIEDNPWVELLSSKK